MLRCCPAVRYNICDPMHQQISDEAWGKLAWLSPEGGGGGSGKWTPVTGRSKEASLKALMMTHHVRHEDFFAEKFSL